MEWFNEYCTHLHLMEEQTKRFVKLNKMILINVPCIQKQVAICNFNVTSTEKKNTHKSKTTTENIHTKIGNEHFLAAISLKTLNWRLNCR